MKYIGLVFCIVSSLLMYSCGKDNDDSNVVSQHYVHKYGFDLSENEWNERSKDGQSITVLENGATLTNTYANGVLHGPTTYTFPNSSIVEKLYIYDEGTLTKEISHDINGIPMREEVYELDDHKIITLWDTHGVPVCIEEYENDSLLNGKYFKPNNEVEASVEAGNGIRIKRDRNGLLQTKDIIQNGLLTKRTTYHPNGEIQSELTFSNYMLHGEQINYSTSGSILMKMYWENGELNGMKTVYRNGVKVMEIPYVKGKRHGVERHFDENNRLAAEIHWENDKKHGSSRFYREDETEILWFYRGKPVSLKKFEEFQYREQLIVDKEHFIDAVNDLDAEDALKE